MVEISFSENFLENNIHKFAVEEAQSIIAIIKEKLKKIEESQYLDSLKLNLNQIPDKIPKKLEYKYQEYQNSICMDSFGIIQRKEAFYFFSKSPRGLLFSIYYFLEWLGCRWFFPGKSFEQLPQKLDMKKSKLEVIEIPDFQNRGLIIDGTLKNLRQWIDFATKHRINWIMLKSMKYFYRLHDDVHKRGLILDCEQKTLGTGFNSNDKNAFRYSQGKLREFIDELPFGTKDIFCYPSDPFFHRSNAFIDKGKRSSDLLLRTLNLLVNLPSQTQHVLHFYANGGCWLVPTVVKPHPLVHTVLAPNHRCFSHSVDDPFCEINKYYVKRELEGFVKVFGSENCVIEDSWLNANLFGHEEFSIWGWLSESGAGRIPHIPLVMKRDIQYYHGLGIKTIFANASGITPSFLKTFTSPIVNFFPKLLWNSNLEIPSLLTEFCASFFNSPKFHMFFDQAEMIDPKDINKQNFAGFLSLTEQRIKLLEEYLNEVVGIRFRNRVKSLLREQKLKISVKNRFVVARVRGFLHLNFFKITRMRC